MSYFVVFFFYFNIINITPNLTVRVFFRFRSSLVPVFGFGQNDCFRQPFFTNLDCSRGYKSSKPTYLEKHSRLFIRIALLLFCGSYIPGLPYKKPVTVVGKTFNCPSLGESVMFWYNTSFWHVTNRQCMQK